MLLSALLLSVLLLSGVLLNMVLLSVVLLSAVLLSALLLSVETRRWRATKCSFTRCSATKCAATKCRDPQVAGAAASNADTTIMASRAFYGFITGNKPAAKQDGGKPKRTWKRKRASLGTTNREFAYPKNLYLDLLKKVRAFSPCVHVVEGCSCALSASLKTVSDCNDRVLILTRLACVSAVFFKVTRGGKQVGVVN